MVTCLAVHLSNPRPAAADPALTERLCDKPPAGPVTELRRNHHGAPHRKRG
jgi:hypothetical protein